MMIFFNCWRFILLILTSTEISSAHPHHKSSCDRECITGLSRTCTYNFQIEEFTTMSKACGNCPFNKTDCSKEGCISAGGFEKVVTVVNGQIPGPTIVVCEGDQVIVNVQNSMINGKGVTIHWHGQFQRETPFMDGVPMITQCPIPLMNTMQYNFTAQPSGTHWWHSHVGLQRGDGIFGGLIVRESNKTNKHRNLYDIDTKDFVFIIIDWTDETTLKRYLGSKHVHKKGILLNGKGQIKKFVINGSTIYTRLSEFNVEKGLRYRFRVINSAVGFCPIEISIDQHNLTVISSDGYDINPVTVDTLNIFNGERYDFVLNANQPNDAYWIRVKGLKDCSNLSQRAILRYNNLNLTGKPTSKAGISKSILNPLRNGKYSDPIYINELKSFGKEKYKPYNISGKPDQVLFLGLGYTKSKSGSYRSQINQLFWKFPNHPLLVQSQGYSENNFCNSTNRPTFNKDKNHVPCVHLLKLKYNQLIELVMYDLGTYVYASHPMHLHGQYYAVVAQKQVYEKISDQRMKEIYSSGEINRNFDNPPLKDTVIAVKAGYTVVRFRATNQGLWLFHCHVVFHLEHGMALVFQVGEPDQWKSPPTSPLRCGNKLESKENSKLTNKKKKLINASIKLRPSILVTLVICTLSWKFFNSIK